MSTDPKAPAAVVYLERSDGRVLALTRGNDFADWHMPGGKKEPRDYDLVATAIREVQEETGIWLALANLRPIYDYVTTHNPRRPGSGDRPVRVFVVDGCAWWPEHFPRYRAGQPAWMPPSFLTLPSCSLADEADIILRAVAADRRRRAALPAHAAAEPGAAR